MNTYTGNYAPQQNMRDEAAQMAPQTPSYGQQLGAALANPRPTTSGAPDLSSLMQMMQQFKMMQGPAGKQPLAPVYDHSFVAPGGQ